MLRDRRILLQIAALCVSALCAVCAGMRCIAYDRSQMIWVTKIAITKIRFILRVVMIPMKSNSAHCVRARATSFLRSRIICLN